MSKSKATKKNTKKNKISSKKLVANKKVTAKKQRQSEETKSHWQSVLVISAITLLIGGIVVWQQFRLQEEIELEADLVIREEVSNEIWVEGEEELELDQEFFDRVIDEIVETEMEVESSTDTGTVTELN